MSIRLTILTNKPLYLQGFYDALRSHVLDAEIVAAAITETQDLSESTIAEAIPIYTQENGPLSDWLESHNSDWLVLIDSQARLDPEILSRFAYRAINIQIMPGLAQTSKAEAIMDEKDPIIAGLQACQQNLAQEMHMIAYLLNGKADAKGIVIGSDSALIYKRDRLETLAMRVQQAVIKTAITALRRLTEGDE